jgi:chromosome segregation ATPase
MFSNEEISEIKTTTVNLSKEMRTMKKLVEDL